MSMEFLVKFFGLLLGVLARTILPWLRKVREGFGFNALLNEGGAWASKPETVEPAAGVAGKPAR